MAFPSENQLISRLAQQFVIKQKLKNILYYCLNFPIATLIQLG
jgi:hypothetical protein